VSVSVGDGVTITLHFRRVFRDHSSDYIEGLFVDAYRGARAVHDAVQRLRQDFIAGRPLDRRVLFLVNRWFGGYKGAGVAASNLFAGTSILALTALELQKVVDVMRKTRDGFNGTITVTEDGSNTNDIAGSTTPPPTVYLYPLFWKEGLIRDRRVGIIYHEMTHIFAGTNDAMGYIDGMGNPPSYDKIPNPGITGLIKNADTYEMFFEEFKSVTTIAPPGSASLPHV
jgi:hypothetical protein